MRDAAPVRTSEPFDVDAVRRDFPILGRAVRDRRLVYLDNAATTQKPRSVIESIERFYEEDNANIHRGVHLLSQQATFGYERARGRIATFINAPESSECIFLRGTTEAANLVAHGFGRPRCGPGDEIIITHMEHHSNIVPWQLLCEATGATLRVVPISDEGVLDLEVYEQLLSEKTCLVAVAHASNVLGTVNPIRQMADLAHEQGAVVFVDGAQGAPHLAVDVQSLGCDFYAFSGHKLFGPTGIGVLWGRRNLLDNMSPYEGGGSMIQTVTLESSTYADVPTRFEAGTPDIAGAISLAAAIDYLNRFGMDSLAAYEDGVLDYAQQQLSQIDSVRLIGTAPGKVSVVAFALKDAHPHDIGTILDMEGIAVRTGHHCAQPLMARYGVPAMARASFAFYNTRDEVDALVTGIKKVGEVLGG
ncbi:MAG: cysteine desulfurase [Gemmatimonadetes bacterium]|nr:cysteine desulfurase [Gemmatimonadota bacterium]MBT5057074.1 cysteine desulfurase [Gemmatimonadota bacterium]MBT5144641.1 cysteine desulfurase [Gemmatimonadota bacterium]MBT5587398.1 cysteine desulfurase [Gemmatimonadota bacterium]MBT5963252.1 cysteine desulfurase [Gemmatimonadota bacterium]